MNKEWYKSKTNWAGILAGLSTIVAGWPDWQLVTGGVVVILAVLGIRGLPILNRTK